MYIEEVHIYMSYTCELAPLIPPPLALCGVRINIRSVSAMQKQLCYSDMYVAMILLCMYVCEMIRTVAPVFSPFHTQPSHYAGFYEDQSLNETYFATVLMPEPFQSCEQEDSNQLGCLYKYDSPVEQCTGGRKGQTSV